jgi:hypothetical protein
MTSFPVDVTTSMRHFSILFNQIFPSLMHPVVHYPETVNAMICQLPQHLVLDQVKVMATETYITCCMEQQQPILLANNGGSTIPAGCCMVGVTPVAKGKGPAYRDDPRSFRAESYGMVQ